MNVLGLKIDEISEAKLPSKTVFSAFPILPSLLKENKVQYAKICRKRWLVSKLCLYRNKFL